MLTFNLKKEWFENPELLKNNKLDKLKVREILNEEK